jgi:multicomponent K+:H+ antiporter subunit G
MIAEAIVAVLVLIGGAFALVGSIGLWRLPDFLTRLHGPTKATTLGVGAIVLAGLAYRVGINGSLGVRELAISVFLFITAPVAAHLLSKVALKQKRK